MSKLNGKYEVVQRENIDEFLDHLGVGVVMKDMAKAFYPIMEVQINGDTYIFRSMSDFSSSELKFKLDQEFQEERFDGKQVISKIVKEGDNKFVQTQKEDKRAPVIIVREFIGDRLVVTGQCEGVTCKFIYKRVTDPPSYTMS